MTFSTKIIQKQYFLDKNIYLLSIINSVLVEANDGIKFNNILITFLFEMTEHRTKRPSTFLLKTYQILQSSEYEQIVRWNEELTGFVIIDQEQFSSIVLPIFFKHNKMHSYIRQLNMYGFSKKRAKNQNYYHHPLFQKDKPELIPEIQRKQEKKIPRHVRESTVSIENRLPTQDPLQRLSQVNYCLLMEQAANLKLIIDELEQIPEKHELEEAAREYLSYHSSILQRFKENKQDQNKTADTLIDKAEE